MKFLVVAASLIVAISGRPDVSHLPSGSYLPGGGSSGQFGSVSGIGGFTSGISGQGSFGSSSHTSFGSQTGFGGQNIGIGGHGGIGIGGIGGGFQDQKHVYFFAAPEQESASRLRIQIVPNSQRNTKIIFVKAPSYGSVQPEVIAPPSISEDKTLVYVLVKRPDHGGQITIPAGAGVRPSKPEVYFIKYKTQQDAQQQIVGGLQGQAVGSNVPDLGNEVNFVRSLDSGVSSSGSLGVSGGISSGSIGSHSSGSHGSNIYTSGGTSHFGPAGASGPY